MNWLDFSLMTLFNTAVCLLLPRVVTLDWSKLVNNFASQISNEGEISSETVAKNIAQ